MCTSHNTKALQRVIIKTAQYIIGTHLRSISDLGEMSAQSPKDTKRQLTPQQQSVPPSAIWQVIHRTRLWSSFSPQSVRPLNSSSALHHKNKFVFH